LHILWILSIFLTPIFLSDLAIIASSNITVLPPNSVFSQTINNNLTQSWTDKENNAKIIFTYEPERPVIDKPTELLFSIQNLHTGEQFKNLYARVIVTDGQRIFKFGNITAPTGDFSVQYIFPDSGTYQVISKIDSKDIATLSSFKVFVPTQSLSSGFKSFSELMLYYVTPITIAAAGIAIYFFYKKNPKMS